MLWESETATATAPTGTYNYWVTAVGPGLNESTPVGPVGGVAP